MPALLLSAVWLGCGDSEPAAHDLTPTITLVRPDGEALATDAAPVPLGARVLLAFDRSVSSDADRATVESQVRLLGPRDAVVPGTFAWNEGFTELTFDPTGMLRYQSTYTISTGPATAGASSSGNPLVTPGHVAFTTMVRGDYDGDGFADLVLASPAKAIGGTTSVGQVYLYRGTAEGVGATPSVTFSTISGPGQPEELFGAAHASADLNGDGFEDLIIGAPGKNSFNGEVQIFNGSPIGLNPTPGVTLAGPQDDAMFGVFLANAGDVNGDGYDDLSISASRYGVGSLDGVGAVFVHHGSANGVAQVPDVTITGESANDALGLWATAGDFNGDGFDDLVIGAPQLLGGYASIHPGSQSGLATDAAIVTRLVGENANDFFGLGMAAADVNGDGYVDLAVGAIGWAGGVGTVYVYPGAAGGIRSVNFARLVGDSQPDHFGLVANAGDVNGDGYEDLLIGAVGAVANARDGKAYLHNGSATGAEQVPSVTWTGSGAEYLGLVYPSLDLNGDGFRDAIIGAPWHDAERGRAFVHYGDGSGFTATPTELAGEAAGDHFSDYMPPT